MKSAYGDHVKVAMDGHVAVVTLDRGPHNFVSVDFMRDLADASQAIDENPEARAVVLQSEGKSFSAGADFSSSTDSVASGMGGINDLYVQAVRLYSVAKPIVAAVQGAAVGAGLGLALVADFRIASPEARFAANFVKLGFHAGFGISLALPRLIGEQRAALMLLTLASYGHIPMVFVLATAIYFGVFGEIYSLFPATSGDTFGAKYATTNNGMLYTAKGTAALLVPFGSIIAKQYGWHAVFVIAVAANAIAALTAIFVIKPMRRNFIQKSNERAPGEAASATARQTSMA